MIKYINIKNLCHHPDNPRKDMGDLSELVESIKAKGILQNLTVVPWVSKFTGKPGDDGSTADEYTVVIGHRRMAAARKAGLTELPCIITDMDYKDQLATMLLENMHRVDLTLYEQAKGMQMMMDLGETVSGISEKTGFSESTVRRRVKLLELDQGKFQESVSRGATLQDFAELEKISDIALKNKALDTIGTNNFNYKLREIRDEEKWRQNKAEVINQLSQFATLVDSSDGYIRVDSYHQYQGGTYEVETPSDSDDTEYVYSINDGCVILFKKGSNTSADEKSQRDTQYEQRKKIHGELEIIAERAYLLRLNFVKEFSSFKKNSTAIIEMSIFSHLCDEWMAEDLLCELFDWKEESEENFTQIMERSQLQSEQSLLFAAYAGTGDSRKNSYFNWSNNYKPNSTLDGLYKHLTMLGYEISDEEVSMMAGTHELFVEEE